MKFYNLFWLMTYVITLKLVAGAITLTPGPVSCNYKKKDLDESYNKGDEVMVNCVTTSCNIKNGNGAVSSTGSLTIAKAGTYVINGSLDGQIRVLATKEDYIHLVLKDLTVRSSSGPSIYIGEADKVTITVVGLNMLFDSTNYTVVDGEPDANIFSDADLSINGPGKLQMTASYSDGIRCKKDLKITGGDILVSNAKQRGIKAKNSICFRNTIIGVSSSDTAIKVTRDDNPEKGFLVVDEGSQITVKAGKKGLHAETHLTVRGGYIDVTQSTEGLEGQMIDILGGEVHILASDDGINASKIKDTTQTNYGGWGFGPGGSGIGTDGSVYVNIVGGKTYVTVQGRDVDGIDSNGVLYIGGNAEVYVCNNGGAIYGNMACFDAEGTNAICSGATVIGTAGGSSGGRWKRQYRPGGNGGYNPPPPPPGGFGGGGFGMESGKVYQTYLQTSITAQTAGTRISVKDKNGAVIASFTPLNAYSSILVTSPKMVAGQSYTVVAGSYSQSFTATAAQSGSVTNPPSITSPDQDSESSSNTTTTTTTTTAKATATATATSTSTPTIQCPDSIIKAGYSCCSSTTCHPILTDKDGDWAVENNQWCGCVRETPQTEESYCPESIIKAGYSCCTETCRVILSDDDGDWGMNNHHWCGCYDKVEPKPDNCAEGVMAQGYTCCYADNCEVVYRDVTSQWGVQNGQWCGIVESECQSN